MYVLKSIVNLPIHQHLLFHFLNIDLYCIYLTNFIKFVYYAAEKKKFFF